MKEKSEKIRIAKNDRQFLLNSMDTQVWYLQSASKYDYANLAHANFLGLEQDSFYGKEIEKVFLSKKTLESNQDVFKEKRDAYSEEWILNAKGKRRLLGIKKVPKINSEGRVEYVICFANDITDSKLQFAKMFSSISSYFSNIVLSQVNEGIGKSLKLMGEFFFVDRVRLYQFTENDTQVIMSHEWSTVKKEKVANVNMQDLKKWSEELKFKESFLVKTVENSQIRSEITKLGINPQSSALFLPLGTNGIIFGVLSFENFENEKILIKEQIILLKVLAEVIAEAFVKYMASDKIRNLTFHDSLTGLYNRLYLEEEMKRLDTPRQLPISLIMADLNSLKLVNDTYGHRAGDKLLEKTAEILKESCRQEDIITRWGGDEFIVFLPKTTEEETNVICRRIKQNCANAFVENIPVSMALGIAIKTTPKKKLIKILKEADSNMYKNKLLRRRREKKRLLDTISRTVSEKSYETKEHIQTMEEMALKLATALSLPNSEKTRLSLVISLHDIGNVNISKYMLKKKEKLTENEWKLIKKHPETGYRIVTATEEFVHVAKDILSHHERWDGTGYPQGLKGDEIPLLAQITAVVDAYEVMKSGRPYKKAKSYNQIVAEFRKCSGSQFEPKLVDMFLQILENETGN